MKAKRDSEKFRFWEFFAGGGMARAGLGGGWDCLFANDFDKAKVNSYVANWGAAEVVCEDISNITKNVLPLIADLAWASFPCQDLSNAGKAKGIGKKDENKPTRSGVFWKFVSLIESLAEVGRSPNIIVLENVFGTVTANKGKDFVLILGALQELGYRFGAVIIDAVHFLPQSRKRLFIVAVKSSVRIPSKIIASMPDENWHPNTLQSAVKRLPDDLLRNWIWWKLPNPPHRSRNLIDIIEDQPNGVKFYSLEKTKSLLAMMSEVNFEKVLQAKRSRKRVVGGIYKRIRLNNEGEKVQRAEVRFDDVAGCLRTPSGGSSRQIIIIVEGNSIKTRLLSPREGARLMGLSEEYKLPEKYNEAYHLTGDGVVVPVVRFLAEHIIEPIAGLNFQRTVSTLDKRKKLHGRAKQTA